MRNRFLVTFLLSLVSSLYAQQGHRMTLNVVVDDKSGTPVQGLQQQDFTLLDNKQRQNILSFREIDNANATSNPPAQVILVLDAVNSSFRAVAQARVQVQKFLSEDGGRLGVPVSLVFFTDSGATMRGTPTMDGKALLAELNSTKTPLRTINRTQGVYGANDRVGLSLRSLDQLAAYEASKPGRKIVVWLSPGWPLLSGPAINLTNKDQQQIFGTIVALSDALHRAQITLCAVDPLGTSDAGGLRTVYYEQFVKGVKRPSDVQIGDEGLQVIATQSGGLVLNSSNDVAGEIEQCVKQARAFYQLTFAAQPADGPNDYHALEVKVDKSGMKVHARTGYYAQP